MYALTIRPPMSHAVMHLGKRVENRTRIERWRGTTGRRIAIHAGKTWEPDYADTVEDITGHHLTDCDVDLAAIIGLATITDVHYADDECCDPWGAQGVGVVHLTLDHVRAVDPIRCRGALGLWRVPEQVTRELEAVGAR